MILLIVANYQHALDWCHEHDVNPRGRDVVIVSASEPHAADRIRGRRLHPGDQVVEHIVYSCLHDAAWKNLGAIEEQLEIMRAFSR